MSDVAASSDPTSQMVYSPSTGDNTWMVSYLDQNGSPVAEYPFGQL